jgi:hypothetical protein
LLNLAFSVTSSASTGTTAVSIDPSSSDLADANGNALPLSVHSGSVSIASSPTAPIVAVADASGARADNPLWPATPAGSNHVASGAPQVDVVTNSTLIGHENAGMPLAAETVDNSLVMGISLSPIALGSAAQPAVSAVNVPPSPHPTGPYTAGVMDSAVAATAIDPATLDSLSTGGSWSEAQQTAHADAIDAALSDPLLVRWI